jgi:hypothetical protein
MAYQRSVSKDGRNNSLVSHIERFVCVRHVAEREIVWLVVGGGMQSSSAIFESLYLNRPAEDLFDLRNAPSRMHTKCSTV